jgi:hypothetical protein
MQYFNLTTATSITPSCGEDVGELLARAAATRLTEIDGWSYDGNSSRISAAQLMFLSADAFDRAASASLGHNRAARYRTAAQGLRREAEEIITKARAAILAAKGK